jgi:hypothetical protein
MSFNRGRKVDTRAAQFYNNNHGSLILGFFDTSAYLKIAPVIDEYRGQRSKPGVNMYDYQKSVMMTLNQTELAMIVDMLGDVMADRIPAIEFVHKSGNNISKMTAGIGLDGESSRLQLCITKNERDYPDAEPIAEVWYEFAPFEAATGDDGAAARTYQPEVTVFKMWAIEALRLSFQSMVHASQLTPRGGYNEDDDDRPRRPAPSRDDDDRPRGQRPPRRDADEDDDRPVGRRPSGAPAPRGTSKPAGRRAAADDSDVGDDGIPF